MKFNNIVLLTLLLSGAANADLPNLVTTSFNHLPSSAIPKIETKTKALSCKADTITNEQTIPSHLTKAKVDNPPPISLEYLNDKINTTYSTMRNGVISYVTKQVAFSLLNFSINGFSAENIATYVSEGTKPYLPFEFANGVKITKVTPRGSTVIYRTEMPINKTHKLATLLALAGNVSASTTICTDITLVDDLLGRDVVIQYDYYDSNGDFFNSFTING